MADFFWNQAENSFQAVWDKFIAATKGNWGTDKALKESDKIKKYSRKQLKEIEAKGGVILDSFAKLRGTLPDSPMAQQLVQQWRDHISAHYYECTVPLLEGLGESYVNQEPIMRDIDRHGMGTAHFMSQAIKIYCMNEYDKFEAKKDEE